MGVHMARRIFIGDIHGESDQLLSLLYQLNIQESDEIIFLGDYIDKGKDTLGVLNILKILNQELPSTRFLWGNHDLMFYEWLTDKNPVYEQTYEGQQTIKQLLNEEEPSHQGKIRLLNQYKWLFNKLEFHAEYPEHVAVHGGLNFTKADPINDTTPYEKVNTRMFISGSPIHKPIIIGHTPQPEIRLTSDKKMVNIDTNCGAGGYLSALIYHKELNLYTDKDGNLIDGMSHNK